MVSDPASGYLDSPVVITKHARERLQIGLRRYRNVSFIDIRTYFLSAAGEWAPSKEGVTLSPDAYGSFIHAIAEVGLQIGKGTLQQKATAGARTQSKPTDKPAKARDKNLDRPAKSISRSDATQTLARLEKVRGRPRIEASSGNRYLLRLGRGDFVELSAARYKKAEEQEFASLTTRGQGVGAERLWWTPRGFFWAPLDITRRELEIALEPRLRRA